jgi:serine/threonine protein kinase
MSPEIVGKREYIGSAVDIWAAGVLLYSMLCGIMPFKAANERDLYRKIQRGVF